MVLAFCNSPYGPLSVYQVLFNSLVHFQRYAPEKLFIAKIEKGSNSVNTADRVMILAFCISSDGPPSMYEVSFNSLEFFQRYDKFLLQKLKGEVTP